MHVNRGPPERVYMKKTQIIIDNFVVVQHGEGNKWHLVITSAQTGSAYCNMTLKDAMDDETLREYVDGFIKWAGKLLGAGSE